MSQGTRRDRDRGRARARRGSRAASRGDGISRREVYDEEKPSWVPVLLVIAVLFVVAIVVTFVF